MSAFRTIETADLPIEAGFLRFVTVKSAHLTGRADLTGYLPPGGHGLRGMPLVILLHGVYGSHWGWALRGNAPRTLQQMVQSGSIPPLALLMPSDGLWGDGSGYLPHSHHDFEQWIVEDVPAVAREIWPEVTQDSPVFIAGLSMGGFGALRLAAKYPQRFRAASGHSSITHFSQLAQFVEEDLAAYRVAPENVSVLDSMLRHRDRLPAIRFDCGTSDPLIEANRELHRQLNDHHVPHFYEEFSGGHEWPYWQKHLEDSLKFFAEIIQRGDGIASLAEKPRNGR